ncbi:MAG: 4Fe-4S dicluster domain-containing protein [bacterium]|nr:4Fe-4S dicluster domain-containing protein [bacterium]
MEKAFLIYPDRCIACRACQVACKQWNQLPAESTINWGSYENPPGLSFHTYTQIHFHELKTEQGIEWLFLKRQCYHCTDAACMLVCPTVAIEKTPEGVVVLNQEKCIGCKYCVYLCPFEVPQFDQASRKVSKCNFCYERIAMGLIPVCAQVCPVAAIRFGDRNELLQQAKSSGSGYKYIYGEREVGGLHVMFALKFPPQKYGLAAHPKVSNALFWWRRLCPPLFGAGIGLALLGVIAHFFRRKISCREESKEEASSL